MHVSEVDIMDSLRCCLFVVGATSLTASTPHHPGSLQPLYTYQPRAHLGARRGGVLNIDCSHLEGFAQATHMCLFV